MQFSGIVCAANCHQTILLVCRLQQMHTHCHTKMLVHRIARSHRSVGSAIETYFAQSIPDCVTIHSIWNILCCKSEPFSLLLSIDRHQYSVSSGAYTSVVVVSLFRFAWLHKHNIFGFVFLSVRRIMAKRNEVNKRNAKRNENFCNTHTERTNERTTEPAMFI